MKRRANTWGIIVMGIMIAFCGIREYKAEAGLRFIKNLGAGINIGNSLDVVGLRERGKDATIDEYALYWGNPPITEKLMKEIYKKGFRTVRVPVSWSEHMDEMGNVETEWMARVTEVVNWGLDTGLYVILDLHHEEWIVPTADKEEEVSLIYGNLWRQIAEQFKECDNKLLFEAMNEPRLKDSEEEWTSGTPEMQQVVNRLNNLFVDIVRSTGGNNECRWLIIPAYCSASETDALQALEVPNDENIIVAVHAYLPYFFTLKDGGSNFWDKTLIRDTEEIDTLMYDLESLFIRKNIPVIITEFGCHEKEDEEQRLAWLNYYLNSFRKIGVPCIWWDNGDESRLINRESFVWYHKNIVDMLIEMQTY